MSDKPDLVERLREEADLCRAETATDVAELLDEAADQIENIRGHAFHQERRAEEFDKGLDIATADYRSLSAETERLRTAIEHAYGALWRDTRSSPIASEARKILLAVLDREGQRRGAQWAQDRFGPVRKWP
ncbi:hypothetical protein [Microvirga massiliensis]|uniref:hypothetical protein n=1 Tax=Microvirga massiliensis TaxID=1033741 RepID=UPI00062B5389|nr:hypothetical protein [Microvirga massiliensis]